MAAAVRVSRRRLVAAGVGDFGDRVATMLGARTGCDVVAADAVAGHLARGTVVVLAMWRPHPALCEQTDELAFRAGVPWLPVVMDHPRIRVGPWGAAPRGPCYHCYQQRKRQHEVQHETVQALEDAYDRDPDCGPAGCLPHHARLAAGLAAMSVASQDAEGIDAVAAQAMVVNTVTGKAASHPVIACHGCPRCSRGDRLGGPTPLMEVLR